MLRNMQNITAFLYFVKEIQPTKYKYCDAYMYVFHMLFVLRVVIEGMNKLPHISKVKQLLYD